MLNLDIRPGYEQRDEHDGVNWAVEVAQPLLAGGGALRKATELRVLGPRPDPLQALALVPATSAHNLGSLMQAIGSAVRVIEARLDPVAKADLQPFTTGASAAVHQATALVRELLELSDSRKAPRENIEITEILREMDELIRLTAGPSIQVELDLHDDAPVVTCSRTELEMMILNLIVDARARMVSDGVLTLSVYREDITGNDDDDDKAANAILRVTDNGSGTSVAVAGLAFRPFFTSMAPSVGDGLGLAVVSKFARDLGGSAEVQTSVGQGTSIILRLPGQGGQPRPYIAAEGLRQAGKQARLTAT